MLSLLLSVSASLAQPAKEVSRELYAALNAGDAQKFAALIDQAAGKEKNELLLYAISRTHGPPVEIIRLLLDKGAEVNQPSRYKTALMHAASEGHAEIASLLLSRGAEIDVQTNEGNALMMAVIGGHTEIVKLLLAAGVDVHAKHRTGDNALIMAARQRSYRTHAPPPDSEILRLLLDRGADPNAVGAWGVTALISANTAEKAKLLIARGANPEARDEQGRTALIKAAAGGDVAVVKALLGSGADVNATDKTGSNALLQSLSLENNAYGEERRTLFERRLEVARTILLKKSVDVNTPNNDGETALMRAVRLDNVELVKLLLARSADPNRSDLFGDTAVVLAYASGNAEIEQLLPRISFKGKPQSVLNAFLRAAVGKKDEATVEELLVSGADPNHEYGIGYAHKAIKQTVLILAATLGEVAIVEKLLKRGADANARGFISGSESGLKFGAALEAAESARHDQVVTLLKGWKQDQQDFQDPY